MNHKKILYLSIFALPLFQGSYAEDTNPKAAQTQPNVQESAPKYKDGFTVFEQGDFKLTLGGRLKVDGYYDVDAQQPGTTYGLDVANIPLKQTGNINAYKKGNFNYSLTASRVYMDVQKKFYGHLYKGYLEVDFNGDSSTTTNSYQLRLRQAYVEGCGWLIGQTWFTFTDINAFIYIFDNLYGTGRQATVRYTFKLTPELSLAIGADRPDTQLYQFAVSDATGALLPSNTGFLDNGSNNGAAKSQYPDGGMQLKYTTKQGYFALRGLIRSLQVRSKEGVNGALKSFKKSKLAWGVGVSTNFKVIECFSIIAQANMGRGIGRYIDDLNNNNGFDSVFIYPTTANAATVYKNFFKAVKAWNVIGGFSWQFTEKFSTNFAYSYTKISEPSEMKNIVATDFQKHFHRFIGNIVYDMLPNTKVGLEVLHYKRKSGTPTQLSGKDTRILASLIYAI